MNIAKDISQKNENGDLVAFDENGLRITFAISHPPNSPHLYSIQASFSSVNELRITGILLKVAVPHILMVFLFSKEHIVFIPLIELKQFLSSNCCICV